MRHPATVLILALSIILLCPARRAEAQAQARPIFERIPICTPLPAPPPKNGKPPGKPLKRWAFGHSGDLITEDDMLFAVLTAGLSIYVYEPSANPGNLRLLPMRYKGLECRPYVPPPPKEPAPKPAPPKEEKKDTKAPKEAPPPEPERDEYGELIPPGVKDKKLPERPPERPRPSPPPPEGVLSNAPLLPASTGILREESVLPSRDEVSPPKYMDEEQTLVDRGGTLPELQHRPGRPLVSVVPCKEIKSGCKGKGEGEKEEETGFDGLAKQLALAAGLATLQPNHDLHRKDGKKYGIVGGENADGINHPAVQAVVSFLQLSAVGRAQVKAIEKKLEEVGKKKAPVVIHSAKELSDDAIAYLRKKYGKKKMAASLAQDQVIGPYEVMSKFTKELNGLYEAHHILEEAMASKWGLTKELDKIPSVILTNAEHKRITKALDEARQRVMVMNKQKDLNTRALWKIYEKVYAEHPRWLEAIRPYFGR